MLLDRAATHRDAHGLKFAGTAVESDARTRNPATIAWIDSTTAASNRFPTFRPPSSPQRITRLGEPNARTEKPFSLVIWSAGSHNFGCAPCLIKGGKQRMVPSYDADMRSSSTVQPPRPEDARTAGEFVAALRALRLWSGLTYRQVEAKAASMGDSLPISTIASALARSTLPREQIVETMARACGLGHTDVRRWIEARHRIAFRPYTGSVSVDHDSAGNGDDEDAGVDLSPASPRPISIRFVVPVLTGALVAGLAIGGYVLYSGRAEQSSPAPSSGPPGSAGPPVTGLTMGMVGSWAEIRAAAAPDLCLTEGRDPAGRYPSAIAVLRPCTQSVPPRTYIRPLGGDRVQIQWHHPVQGIGCLVVRTEGAGRDLLEPWDDCDENRLPQVFRMEPVGRPDVRRYRFHPDHTGMCVGIGDQEVTAGREAVHVLCTGGVDQTFQIELIPPP
jgi:hypothetical protein